MNSAAADDDAKWPDPAMRAVRVPPIQRPERDRPLAYLAVGNPTLDVVRGRRPSLPQGRSEAASEGLREIPRPSPVSRSAGRVPSDRVPTNRVSGGAVGAIDTVEVDTFEVDTFEVDDATNGLSSSYTVGGTVVYAAVQACQLGLSACVAGRAAPSDSEAIALVCGEGVELRLRPAMSTTVFDNSVGQPRIQHLRSWAGPVELDDLPARCQILHLGPVAQEVDLAAADAVDAEFVGVTPQGMLRQWGTSGLVTHRAVPVVPRIRADAVVLAHDELPFARAMVDDVLARRGIVVATRGAAGCTVLTATGSEEYGAFEVAVIDDTGAGDVFAAAFFVELHRGAEVPAAVSFATAAAALSLRGVGVSAVVGREQIALLTERQRAGDPRTYGYRDTGLRQAPKRSGTSR